MKPEQVRAVYRMAQQPISLQSKVGDNDDAKYGDFIPDTSAENPSEQTAYSMLRERLKEILQTLTDRERQVLDYRFGLTDGFSRTLEEVGKQFNASARSKRRPCASCVTPRVSRSSTGSSQAETRHIQSKKKERRRK